MPTPTKKHKTKTKHAPHASIAIQSTPNFVHDLGDFGSCLFIHKGHVESTRFLLKPFLQIVFVPRLGLVGSQQGHAIGTLDQGFKGFAGLDKGFPMLFALGITFGLGGIGMIRHGDFQKGLFDNRIRCTLGIQSQDAKGIETGQFFLVFHGSLLMGMLGNPTSTHGRGGGMIAP